MIEVPPINFPHIDWDSVINGDGKYDTAAMQRAKNQVNVATETISAAKKELDSISLNKLAGKTKSSMKSLIDSNSRCLEGNIKSLGDCIGALDSKIRAVG